MAIPLRLCWEQLDSVWMTWLLESQQYPGMPIQTCPVHGSLQPFSFQRLFPSAPHAGGLDPMSSLGGGGCSQVSALALCWSVSRRPGTCTGQLTLSDVLWLFTAAQRESAPHLLKIQEYPAESLAAPKYWLIGGSLLQSWNSSLLISSLNSPGAARVMDAQPERCLIRMFFNNWMIKYSVIPGTAVPGL